MAWARKLNITELLYLSDPARALFYARNHGPVVVVDSWGRPIMTVSVPRALDDAEEPQSAEPSSDASHASQDVVLR